MTSRIRWSKQIRNLLAPWLKEKAKGAKSNASISMEVLEDRTVPAYVPELGFGQADGYPLQQPGLVTNSIDFTPSDPLSLTGNFYESVNAVNSTGLILSGIGGANLFNTEGPVITVNGGTINLGSGIVYGRASSYTGTITPGNEILVNNNGTAGAFTQDALNNLTVTAEAGSQVLLGDPSASSPLNNFSSNFTIAGEGAGAAGVIQSVNGIEIVSGALTANSTVMVGATTGSTLVLNGPVNGVRSANAFDSFTIAGAGTVILDNVLPVATVAATTPASTNNPLMTFRVTLSEAPQADLTDTSLTVTNGTVTLVTKVNATTYDFSVTSTIPNGQSGSVTAQVAADKITDKAYLGNLASNIATVAIDRQSPTGSGTFPNIGQSLASATQATINITFTDNGGVGIDATSIAASNLLVTDSNGGNLGVAANPTFNAATGVATYAVLPGTTWAAYSQAGPVTVTVSLVANGVKDLVGNGVEAAVVNTFIVDTNSPSIIINDGFPIPAAKADNTIKITTNKDIASFDATKFTATNGSIVSVTKLDATTLNVVVSASAPAIQQVILLNIAAGAITDGFGNTSKAVTPSQGYTFDTLKPTVSLNTPPDTINAANANIDNLVDFNAFDPTFQNVLGSGVDISTILLSSIKVTDPNGTQISVKDLIKFNDPAGASAIIPASQFPGGTWAGAVQGTYTITIQNFNDNAGNTVNPTVIGTFLVATTKPSVTLTANPTTNIDGVSVVTIDFTTVGNTTVSGLTLDDFTVGGFGVLSNLHQLAPNKYEVDVTPTTPNAAVTLTLPANTVTDNADNGNTASAPLNLAFTVTNPIPSFSNISGTPTNNVVIQGIVTFTEAVNLTSTLLKLSQSDFNFTTGTVANFTATDTSDGINFPFSITLTNADQVAKFNIKAGIATEQAGINLPNIAGSPASITLVVSSPTATLTAPISPVNATVDPAAEIAFAVQFTSGLNVGLDYTNAATALSITKGGLFLDYTVESIDTVNNIVHYLIKPPTGGAWTDTAAQGTWSVDILANQISDNAGNFVPAGNLGSFVVATKQPTSNLIFEGAGAIDYTLNWVNASSPGQIVLRLSPADSNGGALPAANLDTTIVPTIANFTANNFNVVSVSNAWQDPLTAPYILITLEPSQDIMGDTASIGAASASLVVKANAFFDVFGNGNSEVDSANLPQNGLGYLSMVGIDRVAPIYTTSGLNPQQINGNQTTDPVTVRISFSDITSGVNLTTLAATNLILTLDADTTTNVADITGQVDPNDNSTFIYTLTPKSGNWVTGTYTLRFTNTAAETVYDQAQNVLFTPTSANGIAPGIVMNAGQPVTFAAHIEAPTVTDAKLLPLGPTNSSPLNGSVTFSEVVQGFNAGALGLQGATLTSAISTVDNLTFTFELTPISTMEMVNYTVLTGTGVTDTFGNPLATGATSNTVTFDAQGPTATLTSAPININIANGTGNTNTFQVTFTDTAGVDPNSITVANYSVDNGATISGVTFDAITGIATYTVTGSGASWSASNQGTYLITPSAIPSNLPKDTLGNTATLPSTSFSVDTVAPDVSSVTFLNNDPTNLANLTVEIVFTKPATFGTPGLDFTNLFTVTNAIASSITQIDPVTYQVNVQPTTNPPGERLVTFQVKAGAATDTAGNPSTASSVAQINFDNLGPQLTIVPQGLINNATNQQIITVIVNVDPSSPYNFSDQPQAGIVLTNATYVGGSFSPTDTLPHTQYSFQIMATNPGLVTVGMGADTFDDALGNGNIQTTVDYQYRPALTVAVTSPDVVEGGTTTLSSLNFKAIFNGPIVSFNANDFFTLTNATVTNLAQDAVDKTLFTYTVTPLAGGSVSVQVKAGAATDDIGQTNEASTPFTFTYDQQIVVSSTLSTVATPVTSLKSIPVTLTFSQPVTGLDINNFISKFTVAGATLDPTFFQADATGQTYQVLLLPTSVPGSSAPVAVSLQFNAGSVVPSNQVSNTISLSYINQAGAIGLGVGGSASLTRADGSILPVNVFPGFTGGVRVASGNYASTGSGTLDLLAGAGPGGGPAVKVINGNTGATALSFFAFGSNFTGGVYVASGDVNHDGFNDYVVSAGPGGGPHVKVFSGNPADVANGIPATIASFFAYSSAFAGGSTVAVADINGDGFADVITGAGPGGGPHVEVFSGAALANNQQVLLASFFSGSPTNTAGLFVAAGDLGGDGSIQIITGTGAGVTGIVNVLTLMQQVPNNYFIVDNAQTKTIQPYDTLFTGGVRVSAINTQQSTGGSIDLATAPGAGGGPNIKVFDPLNNFALVDSFFFPDDPNYTGGVYIG